MTQSNTEHGVKASQAKYVRVRELLKYHHCEVRNPPWIRLHRSLLSNYEFNCLQDASKAHLMMIWVLASQHSNALPYDADWIAREIHAETTVDLDELIEAGFLEPLGDDASCSQDDSTPLAEREQNGVPRDQRTENRETSTASDSNESGDEPPSSKTPKNRTLFEGLSDGGWIYRCEGKAAPKGLRLGRNELSLSDIPELPKNTQTALWLSVLDTKPRCQSFLERLEQRGMRRFEFAAKSLKHAREINSDYPNMGVEALFWTAVHADLWDYLAIPEIEHEKDVHAYLNSWVWNTKADDEYVSLIVQAWREYVPQAASDDEDAEGEFPVDGLTEAVSA